MSARRTWSERVYRLLLRAYPPRFREEYAEDATELFRDRLREAREGRGLVAVASLWVRTVPNVLVHAVLERFADVRREVAAERGVTLRGAIRSLTRAPALTAVIVLTLGVGIGANVALFGVLRGVLLEPLPYPEADRLVRLWESNPDVDEALRGPSPLNIADWMRADTDFSSMAAWYLTSGTYRTDTWVEEIRSAQVTADFFRTLGIAPMLGRDFRPDEVARYGPVMLSHAVWVRLFGSDPGIVGRTIVASGGTYEIVGVMPPDFTFPDESVQTWVAWDLANVYADRPESRTWRFLEGIARLAPGASVEGAAESLDAVAVRLEEAHPEANRGWRTDVTSLRDEIVGDVSGTLWIAFGSVLFILLIACVNVANLQLARVPIRGRELAVRSALGASRGRLARELVWENVLIGVGAGLLGLVIGALLLDLLVALDAGRIPRLAEVDLDAGVFVFAVAAALLTSVLFGLVPAIATLDGASARTLRDGTRTTATRLQRAARDVFVAAQVAIALVLLTGAGLFAESLRALVDVDPGIEPERVATFRISLDPVDGTEEEIVLYYQGLLQRLRAVPGVEAVGASQTLPLNPIGNDFRRPYRPAGSAIATADAPTVQMRITTPSYVEAVGMRLLEGTPLPESVSLGEPLVALVNRTLANRLWPDGGAVGRTFEIDFRGGWAPYTVVGVVQDVKHYGPRAGPAPEVFLSHWQVPYLAMSIATRTVGDPEAMIEPLRRAVLEHRAMQPAHDFGTLDRLARASTAEERFLSVLLGILSAIALGLATTGVYGVIAYSVSHRRREIGVRMALGARSRAVALSVLGRGLAIAGVGLGVGLVAVRLLGTTVEGLLFGVRASDLGTELAVCALLLVVSAAAAWLPARRAAAVAPTEALRAE